MALKEHDNLGPSMEGLSEAEKVLFEGKEKMMKHVKFYSLVDVDEKGVVRSC